MHGIKCEFLYQFWTFLHHALINDQLHVLLIFAHLHVSVKGLSPGVISKVG